MEQSPKGSSKLFTDVLCLCAIHESRVKSSCQSPSPYCPWSRAMWWICHSYVNLSLCVNELACIEWACRDRPITAHMGWATTLQSHAPLWHTGQSIKRVFHCVPKQCLCNTFFLFPFECIVSRNIFTAHIFQLSRCLLFHLAISPQELVVRFLVVGCRARYKNAVSQTWLAPLLWIVGNKGLTTAWALVETVTGK